jgi:magnesium transporter
MGVVATITRFAEGRPEPAACDLEDVDALRGSGETLWADQDTLDADELDGLAKVFQLHPLAVRHALERERRPTFEEYGNHLFLTVYAALVRDGQLTPVEVGIFAGKGFVVTVHDGADAIFQQARERSADDARAIGTDGVGYLLYAILDVLVQGYDEALDSFEETIDEIDERLLASRDQEGMRIAYRLKKQLLRLRRVVSPLREVLQGVLRADERVLGDPVDPYLRDVYDRVVRQTEEIDTYRELLTAAMEAQLSVIANAQNSDMKLLTGWGAILLVPTIITGVYGMNFRHMPELHWRLGYPLALALILGLMVATYALFRHRGWLSPDR